MFDVLESRRSPDLTEPVWSPFRVQFGPDRPEAVKGVKTERHDVVVQEIVHISGLRFDRHWVYLTRSTGDVFLQPRVLGPEVERGPVRVVASADDGGQPRTGAVETLRQM